MKVIKTSFQSLRFHGARKKSGDDIPNPRADCWEKCEIEDAVPEKQHNAVQEEINKRSQIYDRRDSAIRERVSWREES
jgi:hypothetical protein